MCVLLYKKEGHREAETLLVDELESPIETVAKDLEAHDLVAFMAPSCRLLLMEGSLRYVATVCSKRFPNRPQTSFDNLTMVGEIKCSNLKTTNTVARARQVSWRNRFSGDLLLAHVTGQFSGSALLFRFPRRGAFSTGVSSTGLIPTPTSTQKRLCAE